MNNIYKNFKEGGPVRGLARISAILIMIMVWILIDKGNIYGQSISDSDAIAKSEKLDVTSSALLKAGGGDGDITDEGSDSDDDNSFGVYPNPVQGDLVFDFEFTVRTGAPYEVLDAHGKLVDKGVIKPGVTHHSVDMRDLSTGLYILRVELGGKLHVKRVIKQ
ncbi:MAG: T9SS type A sorting domain-containing protein [Flavobacteriales bacterium]|nr:T9SS type A sorting domain-containing protein [Flavobacteriales bacterium]MCB9203508.1 T9SS type A sorting domain-containing protein [Flavobacteriales bacterium]